MSLPRIYRLPKPNEFGHYWLDEPGHCPAILRIAGRERVKAVGEGKFMVSLDGGVVFDADNKIRAFDSPQDALRYINQRAHLPR